ncbi:hypothetical protein [Spiroplasma turonicum]|uniref:Uncharacterized protein n=1 Tax=Spiroplasma turonicum TaxID=216946 RepID=A0A0K1P6T4_9MOLU|nr:hypothetical protein [Spiroplasma turonicum]AKU79980.1 hypothetical protein STURON_00734 [Spiroplasma turonicum]ALX70983.1 hypothetical protein STURO_v1c07320 [Spiroplasma turonicum]
MQKHKLFFTNIPFSILSILLVSLTLSGAFKIIIPIVTLDKLLDFILLTISGSLFILIIIKIIFHIKDLSKIIKKNKESVPFFGFVTMSILAFSKYFLSNSTDSIINYNIGLYLWWFGLIFSFSFLLFWVFLNIKNLSYKNFNPSWYIPLNGFIVSSTFDIKYLNKDYFNLWFVIWLLFFILFTITTINLLIKYLNNIDRNECSSFFITFIGIYSLLIITYFYTFKNTNFFLDNLLIVIGFIPIILSFVLYHLIFISLKKEFFHFKHINLCFPLAMATMEKWIYSQYFFNLDSLSVLKKIFYYTFIIDIIITAIFTLYLLGFILSIYIKKYINLHNVKILNNK